ncbi:LytR/AlgR family response regulator transcription factor [Evansella sp. AB-rgal1]|uniref:LytR/AlgR family response regulator transcription factor n=1 Tax=Evansella sp. AB-rgal1 TaxID=3242696 RepID=UPI00359F0C48
MQILKILIAEDNEDTRNILSRFIEYFPNMKVVGEVKDGQQLLDFLFTHGKKIDVVLVDIHMPRLNGVEAIKLCKQFQPSLKFIFITGDVGYAVEAFSICAVDYVVKPIQQQRLYEALQKAANIIGLESNQSVSNEKKPTNSKLVVKSGRTTFYLPVEVIFFIEKQGKVTLIHTKNGVYETIDSLESIEKDLHKPSFYRTHRSYIVNLKHIISIESFGKTFLAHFANYHKTAHISKLNINDVKDLIQ